MKKPFGILIAIVIAAALTSAIIVFVIRDRNARANHRNPATMDPALVESLLTPTASPELKGTFDQKAGRIPLAELARFKLVTRHWSFVCYWRL